MPEWLVAVGLIGGFIAIVGGCVYFDIKNERDCQRWLKWKREEDAWQDAHRHCVSRPYKRRNVR